MFAIMVLQQHLLNCLCGIIGIMVTICRTVADECRWSDGYEDSWEPEDNLPAPLIEQWEEKQKQRLLESMQTASHSSNRSNNGHQEPANGVPTRRTGRDKGSAREESRGMQPQPVS